MNYPLMASLTSAPIDDTRRVLNDIGICRQHTCDNMMTPLRMNLKVSDLYSGSVDVIYDVEASKCVPLIKIIQSLSLLSPDQSSLSKVGRWLFKNILRALDYLSNLRIRHLVISPKNIFLCKKNHAKLPRPMLGPFISRASFKFALAAAACPKPPTIAGTLQLQKEEDESLNNSIYTDTQYNPDAYAFEPFTIENVVNLSPCALAFPLGPSSSMEVEEYVHASDEPSPSSSTSGDFSNYSTSSSCKSIPLAAQLPVFEGADALEGLLPWCAPELQQLLIGDATWRQLACPLLPARVADKGRVPAVLEQLRASDIWSTGLVLSELLLLNKDGSSVDRVSPYPSILGNSIGDSLVNSQTGTLYNLYKLPYLVQELMTKMLSLKAINRCSPYLALCHGSLWGFDEGEKLCYQLRNLFDSIRLGLENKVTLLQRQQNQDTLKEFLESDVVILVDKLEILLKPLENKFQDFFKRRECKSSNIQERISKQKSKLNEANQEEEIEAKEIAWQNMAEDFYELYSALDKIAVAYIPLTSVAPPVPLSMACANLQLNKFSELIYQILCACSNGHGDEALSTTEQRKLYEVLGIAGSIDGVPSKKEFLNDSINFEKCQNEKRFFMSSFDCLN